MTRPELFVFIALAVGWIALAAWTHRIARKVDRMGSLEWGTPREEAP
jgi:hypothetical protein